MRYKAGDKVKIKTWKDMEEKYGLDSVGDIKCFCNFTENMEKKLNDLYPNRIVIISKIETTYYSVENVGWAWSDDMIEGLASELEIIDPKDKINSRFEILDL